MTKFLKVAFAISLLLLSIPASATPQGPQPAGSVQENPPNLTLGSNGNGTNAQVTPDALITITDLDFNPLYQIAQSADGTHSMTCCFTVTHSTAGNPVEYREISDTTVPFSGGRHFDGPVSPASPLLWKIQGVTYTVNLAALVGKYFVNVKSVQIFLRANSRLVLHPYFYDPDIVLTTFNLSPTIGWAVSSGGGK